MNGRNTSCFKKIIAIACAAAFLLGVLYGCLLLSYYHADSGYTDGNLPAILSAAAIAMFLLLGGFTARAVKGTFARAPSAAVNGDTLTERIIRAVFAAGLLAIPFAFLLGNEYDPLKSIGKDQPKLLLISVRWSVIFAAIAGVSMLLFAILKPKNPNVRFLLYLPSSLFTLTYVLHRYLDTSVLLTDQRRMLSILAIAAFSLFIVGEMRLLTGRFSAYYYALTGFLSLVTLSLSGVGTIVLHVGNGGSDGIRLAFTVTEALGALLVGVRLLRVFGEIEADPTKGDETQV